MGLSKRAIRRLNKPRHRNLSRYYIASPLKGEVIAVKATAGSSVKADDVLYEIADLRTVWVETRVPAIIISRFWKSSA